MTDETMTTDVVQEDEYDQAFNEFAGDSKAEEPVEEVEQEESETVSQDTKTVEETDEPEEVSELEQLRQERDKYRHAFDANRGRVSAFQKKLNAQEAEIERLSKATVATDNPENSGMTDEAWKDFESEYPEMAQAIVAREAYQKQMIEQSIEQRVNSRLAQYDDVINPLKQSAHESYIESQTGVLEAKHPDWKETVSSEQFSKWIAAQPEDMQARVNSEDASDASYLLDVFKAMNGSANTSAKKQVSNNRLASSVGVKARGGRQSSGIPNEYDAAWDYFAKK